MVDQKTIILISFGYMSLLFAIAFYGDKRTQINKSIISNPCIYALYVALLLAVFAIVFGTSHLDATERHEGLVAAIAFESIVKLVAFICAGLFVTHGIFSGLDDLFSQASLVPEISALFVMDVDSSTFISWYNGLFLSMVAVLFLPRQFQVMVVENVDEKHLKKAIWLFPLYLLAINIFVLPIAFAGMLKFAGQTADTDFFALFLFKTCPASRLKSAFAGYKKGQYSGGPGSGISLFPFCC